MSGLVNKSELEIVVLLSETSISSVLQNEIGEVGAIEALLTTPGKETDPVLGRGGVDNNVILAVVKEDGLICSTAKATLSATLCMKSLDKWA
jgi:hypothetical protein